LTMRSISGASSMRNLNRPNGLLPEKF